MEITDSSYKLDSKEFDQALSVLDEERRLIPLTKLNKVSFLLLNISTYGVVIVFMLYFLLLLFDLDTPYYAESSWKYIITLTVSALLVTLILTLPVILLLNLPLVKNIRQNIKLSREIGLYKLVNDQLLVFRKRGRFRNVLTSILALLGFLITLLLVIYLVFGDFPENERILFIVITAIWCIVASALIATHFIRRGKERLDILTKSLLLSKESAQQTNADQIDVSIEDYELIAEIERAQVSRSQYQSIITSLEDSKATNYYIQKSYSVKEALSLLDINERSLIENRIYDLGLEPIPSEAKKLTESESYLLSLREPTYNIYYQVDESNHLIQILTLNKIEMNSVSNSEKGE